MFSLPLSKSVEKKWTAYEQIFRKYVLNNKYNVFVMQQQES